MSNGFQFQPEEDGSLTLEEAVYQAIGRASTCWDSMHGLGVFQEQDAREVAEALLEKIRSDLGPKGPRLGMATTQELLTELEARTRIGLSGTGPDSMREALVAEECKKALERLPDKVLMYRTVDS